MNDERMNDERGQSIVLLAGAMVALLVFAGLAVDAGVIYMGMLHLSRAVDAGALAGVVELPNDDTDFPSIPFKRRTKYADGKALGFLGANGIRPTEFITGTEFFRSSRDAGVIGSYRYRITATHQVDLYFLPLVNFTYVKLRDTALADYNPWVDIYTDQSGALGILTTVNQSFKGRAESAERGDAFSPSNSPWWDELRGKYIYRIYVPNHYHGTLRVEILDPDDFDAGSGAVKTGDSSVPLHFLGLDEGTSNNPIRFTLFYYRLMLDGRLERRDIAQYIGTAGNNAHGTDLMWVCPGAEQAPDYAGSSVPTQFGSFEIDLKNDVLMIFVNERGDRYIYLEAESLGQHRENSFDLWAGPVYPDLPGEVNARNQAIVYGGLEQAHGSKGVIIYAVGHMAFNSNALNRVEMQLADIPASWAGHRIRIDAFDIDTNTEPPLIFYFDTMPRGDWSVCYDDILAGCVKAGQRCEDFGHVAAGRAYLVNDRCESGVSNNQWHTYEFVLPPREFFYGGRLMVSYGGGNMDNVTLRMMVETAPRLLE